MSRRTMMWAGVAFIYIVFGVAIFGFGVGAREVLFSGEKDGVKYIFSQSWKDGSTYLLLVYSDGTTVNICDYDGDEIIGSDRRDFYSFSRGKASIVYTKEQVIIENWEEAVSQQEALVQATKIFQDWLIKIIAVEEMIEMIE